MAPQKTRSGCLFFSLAAVAGLLAIANSISNDITARRAGQFFLAFTLILILSGRQWSGKDIVAETRQYWEVAHSRNFFIAWWMLTMGYFGLASLAFFVIYPFAAAIVRACGIQSLALDIPGKQVFLVSSVLGLISVLTRKPKVHHESRHNSKEGDGAPV